MAQVLETKVLAELAKIFDRDVTEFTPELRFKEDLVTSSMQKLMIVAVIEELTGQQVTYGQMHRRKTVGELLDWIGELHPA
ncbi:MAG: hypothetical protein VB093_00350 [Propionicimonas sp.]|nr:hypothetical protein [Propionicimonas sp.]MEA5116782.1 hypothetical protein [Propionicimonas sp.]